MLNKKFIIAFIAALIALIVIGFVALNFVPTNDLVNVDVSGNLSELADNSSVNISEDLDKLNVTVDNSTDANDTDVNDTNTSSNSTDPGDILKKQTFTISENETGQNAGMEPGTYVMYYTENDGPIKIQKVV